MDSNLERVGMQRVRTWRSGVLASFALVLMVVAGCGRERTNPIDSSFSGNEALSPPTGIQAASGIGRITLQWNAVTSSDLAGYGVWRSTQATSGYTRLAGEVADSLISTSRTTFIDTTVDFSTARVYFYRIGTVDVDRRSSDLSVYVSGEVLEDNRPPAVPQDLSAVSDVVTGYVTLTWNAPLTDSNNQPLTGLDAFLIFRAKDSEDAFVQIATLPAAQTTYVDSASLESGSRYFYRVSAADGLGNRSSRSSAASISPGTAGIATPTGLATTSQIGRVEVRWNAVNDPLLVGYLLLRSTNTTSGFAPVTSDTLITTAQTTYVDTGIPSGQVVFYKVQAVGTDPGIGTIRSVESGFVDGESLADEVPPGAPRDLILTVDENMPGQVGLSWTPPSTDSDGGELTSLTGYQVFRSRQTSTSFAKIADLSSSQTTYVDTTVASVTLYYYAVSAVDSAGNVGPRSTSASVTTQASELAAPRNVTATAGIHRITISWSANTEDLLTGYRVLRLQDAASTTPVASFETVQTSFVDSLLTGGQTLVYRVEALGQDGLVSKRSSFASATVLFDTRPPAAPSNVASELLSSSSIRVSWTAPTTDVGGASRTGLNRFRVYRAVGTTSAGFVAIAVPDSTVGSYTNTGLDANQTYFYRITALDSEGNESAVSATVSQTTTSAVSPPTNLSATADSTPRVVLSWTPPGTYTSFNVERKVVSSNSGGAFTTIAFNVNNTGYEDTNVSSNVAYVYRIVTNSGSLVSEPSAEVTVAVP